ncbi:hypothetical protein SDC9_124247 [bioreactor metagenome]|uniref:Uncharacterized protein n=1 Tax=bioreactor metagenome TaxID=1076179 RepID=A0A645CJW8_9ZZZZ
MAESYYTELIWMIPLTIFSFACAAMLLYGVYRKGFFNKWTKPRMK